MIRGLLFILAVAAPSLRAAISDDSLVAPAYLLHPGDLAWRELVGGFEQRRAIIADFEERRFFPFKSAPAILSGEARVSPDRGLSLHYTKPEERVVIFDAQGLLVREAAGTRAAPADPRAAAMQGALLHILRLDFRALAPAFEIYGLQEGGAWRLVFVPRAEPLRRSIGRIVVAGLGDALRRIELRHSERQYVEITLGLPRPAVAFTADELRRYFR